MRKGLLITASATALLVAGAAQAGTVYEGDDVTFAADIEVGHWYQFNSEGAESSVGGFDADHTLSGVLSGSSNGLSWSAAANATDGTGSIAIGGDFGTIYSQNTSYDDSSAYLAITEEPAAGPDEFATQAVSVEGFGELDVNPDSAGVGRIGYRGSAGPAKILADFAPSGYGAKGLGTYSVGARYSGDMGGFSGGAGVGISGDDDRTIFGAGADISLTALTVGGYVAQETDSSGSSDVSVTDFGAGVTSGALGDKVTVGANFEASTGDTGNGNTHTYLRAGVEYGLTDLVSVSADVNSVNDGDTSEFGVVTKATAAW